MSGAHGQIYPRDFGELDEDDSVGFFMEHEGAVCSIAKVFWFSFAAIALCLGLLLMAQRPTDPNGPMSWQDGQFFVVNRSFGDLHVLRINRLYRVVGTDQDNSLRVEYMYGPWPLNKERRESTLSAKWLKENVRRSDCTVVNGSDRKYTEQIAELTGVIKNAALAGR